MIELGGKVGEVVMTLQITRKETGKTEEVQLVGYLDEEQLKALEAEQSKEQ